MSELISDTLYTGHAGAYEILVSYEDYQGNLPRAIQAIQPLARYIKRLHAFDYTVSMLWLAQAKQRLNRWQNVFLALADRRRMPVRSGWADFAIEGWAFLQIAVWQPDDWQNQLECALAEMHRLARPGGKLILVEALGTGKATPK